MTRPIDETVLTAYALGELDPTEAAGVQALLEHDAEARQLVEDLRDLAALAHEALMDEPALTGEQRQAIMEQAEARDRLDVPAYTPVAKPLLAPPPTTPDEDEKVVPLRPKRRRMLWTLRITAAAATVLVSAGIATSMFVMHSPGSNIMMRTIAQGDRAASSGTEAPDGVGLVDHRPSSVAAS